MTNISELLTNGKPVIARGFRGKGPVPRPIVEPSPIPTDQALSPLQPAPLSPAPPIPGLQLVPVNRHDKPLNSPAKAALIWSTHSAAETQNVRLPVILTEGKDNVDALSKYASTITGPSRLAQVLPVGLPQAWRNVTSESADRLFSALSKQLRWEDKSSNSPAPRPVTLAFDRDMEATEQLRVLTNWLQKEHAAVMRFAWPNEPADAATIAQLLNSVEAQQLGRLLKCLSQRAPVQDSRPDDSAPATALPTEKFAAAITVCNHFARDSGGLLYRFEGGVYRPTGEAFIESRVKQLLSAWDGLATWRSAIAREVHEFIRVDAPLLWETPPADIINVENGLLDVFGRALSPHSPEFLSAIRIPVLYDPSATCPAVDKFVSEVLPPDAAALAWELVAWALSPDTSIHASALLLGEGANGKSTFLALLQAVLGRTNCTNIALQKLESDRFAPARLYGKLANLCPDLPTARLTGTSMFKSLTGGDSITGERKYEESFEFTPFAKLLFSANQPPPSDDSTHGYYRRWLIVRFDQVFDSDSGTALPRSELDKRLSQPAELSGLLNHALDSLPRLRQSGFTQSASTLEAAAVFRHETDPLSIWLDQRIDAAPDEFVPKRRLFDAYKAHCATERRPAMTSTAFGKAVKRWRKGIIGEAQKTVDGKEKVDCYIGIKMLRAHMGVVYS